MIRVTRIALPLLLLAAHQAAQGAELHARIGWEKDVPHVEVRVTNATPEQLKQAQAVVWVFDVKGHFQEEEVKVPFAKDEEVSATQRIELKQIKEPKKPHHVKVRLAGPGLAYTASCVLHFASPAQGVRYYGLRRAGVFPDERVFAVFRLKGFPKSKAVKEVSLDLRLQDSQANVVLKKVETMPVRPDGSNAEIEITPGRGQSVGPYNLECTIENEALGLSFNWSTTVAWANAAVPVSSFEIGDRTWFLPGVNPSYLRGSFNANTPQFPNWHPPAAEPPNQHTSTRYYSPELYPDREAEYPRLNYDPEIRHSGRQSLRVDYEEGRSASIFSLQYLPGFPVHGRLWVKGNGSGDRLGIHWIDTTDLTKAGWGRSMCWAYYDLGALDFEDWRCFRVPVVGKGCQVKSYTGNTTEVDVPIRLLAVTIHTKRPRRKDQPPPAKRSVWLDSLAAETQVLPSEQISLELRTDTRDQALHKDARLFVSVGNGASQDLEKGRLNVSVKDVAGKTVYEVTADITVKADTFLVQEFSMSELHAKMPRGPLDVDVTFLAPAVSGLRRTERIVLKAPRAAGLVWDFEHADEYTRYGLLKRPASSTSQQQRMDTVATPTPGGANGSNHSLRLVVQQPPEENASNQPRSYATFPEGVPSAQVLLHPALPGEVARIRMLVKCDGEPVELEPVLIDRGMTGVSNKAANEFWLPPQRIDWQDWRPVEFAVPPPPAFYQNKKREFLREPVYPLNLLLRVVGELGKEASLWVDDISAITHLPPDQELQAAVQFPDATRIHAPGAPLDLVLNNFAARPSRVKASWELRTFQNALVASRKLDVTVPPGQKLKTTLVPSMKLGIYQLRVTDLPGPDLHELVYVLDAKQYFGEDPLAFLKQVPEIRKSIGLTTEMVRLDWDNSEPVPGVLHHRWFDVISEQKSVGGKYDVLPVVGFSADWAGRGARESVAKGTYVRYMPNFLQLPARLVDWDRFVRKLVRKRAGQYSHWVFWENPDLKHGLQSIPPAWYPKMLGAFHKWVSRYDPKAKVVAGGFNMDYVLDYLESIENPAALPFDEIAVRMSMGELSPEEADLEGFLDELSELLQLEKTKRRVQITSLDWGIGEFVSAAQQAAYHVRAALMLNSRGAPFHRFACINNAQSFEGYGVFYRTKYGNSNLQDFRTVRVPKPSYFAIAHTRGFLADWRFVKAVRLHDARPGAHRAYIFRNNAGQLTLVVWRGEPAARSYRLPATWKGAQARDAFGFGIRLGHTLICTGFPTFVRLPDGYALNQLIHDIRLMQPVDGKDLLVLNLHVAEPDSCGKAKYQATGDPQPFHKIGNAPGDRRKRETFVGGLKTEQFEFRVAEVGHVLLTRRWYLEKGQQLWIKLSSGPDDGPEQVWDLRPDKQLQAALKTPNLYRAGVRESTFVLRDCRAGANTVAIRYEEPGNCSSYRVEPLRGKHVELAKWAPLNVLQTKGELRLYRNAQDTPLRIGEKTYESGLGTHAVALLELPLDRQFSSIEVTVGIDAVTEGRGTVIFEIHADGETKATSGLMNGFSPAKTLKVTDLDEVKRLLLLVKDAGDGNSEDLADWVEGRLILK